jgi:DNA segregation ATPase FtsK/SpoIIIE-like protein
MVTDDVLESYDKMLEEGRRMQQMVAKNPNTVYIMSFTKPDYVKDGTEILLEIRPDFRHSHAAIKLDIEFAKAVLVNDEDLKLIEKVAEMLRVWGIETIQLDLNGNIGPRYETKITYNPNRDYKHSRPEVNKQEQDFVNKIPKKELTVEQIQYYIEFGRKLRENRKQQNPAYELKTEAESLDISVEIKPNFEKKSAFIQVSDNFDPENKMHMELVGFAVLIAKLWDLQSYSVGKIRNE